MRPATPRPATPRATAELRRIAELLATTATAEQTGAERRRKQTCAICRALFDAVDDDDNVDSVVDARKRRACET